MAVVLPIQDNEHTSNLRKNDCYLDDIIAVIMDCPSSVQRWSTAAPLAIFLSLWPHTKDKEPIPRKPGLSPAKMEAEGTPAELQVVLGWDINTRLLIICLPLNKFKTWSKDIQNLINNTAHRISEQDLDSLIGRLNHAAYVIPLAQHFLNCLCHHLQHFQEEHRNINSCRFYLYLLHEELKDLRLWLIFLKRAQDGLLLNGLVLQNPTQITISDSYPFRLGGVTYLGWAWRLKVTFAPQFSANSSANNVLEFIALAITLKLEIKECRKQGLTEEVILALADNTSAIGWIFKTSKIRKNSKYFKATNFIARSIPKWFMESNNFIGGKHIKGEHNFIPDVLSFEGSVRVWGKGGFSNKQNHLIFDNPPNGVLTNCILSQYPQTAPAHFCISHLDTETFSWALQTIDFLGLCWHQG